MSDIIMDDPEENTGQNNENNDSPQDHLMNFIQDQEKTPKQQEFDNIERFGPNTRQKVDKIELNKVAGRLKTVDPQAGIITEAKAMGICFGD